MSGLFYIFYILFISSYFFFYVAVVVVVANVFEIENNSLCLSSFMYEGNCGNYENKERGIPGWLK